MKPIYRVLVLGILTMALNAVTATSTFAQDPCAEVEAKQAVYKRFTDNFASKALAQRKTAVEAGKEYVQKYGNCPDDKEIVSYLNTNIPKIESGIAKVEGQQKIGERYTRFNTAITAKNTADIFTVGKEILATDPELVDVMLVLATAGYDQATAKPPVDTYNNEAINYAKSAIQKLDANAKSKTGDYGVLTYSYKDKENARGWMNYIIGYIDYYRLGKKDEALSYFYKAAQTTSSTKTNPYLYQTFGSYYRDEVVRLGDEIVVKLKANNNQATDETKALIAMQKGYADRAADAYARAYTVADKAPAGKDYRDGLYGSLKEIYNLRYEGKRTDVDVYANSVSSRPMPDPTTKVTPVAEEVPAAAATPAATTTTPGTTTPTATSTKPGTTKPAIMNDSKTPTKPMSSTTTTKPETTKVTVTKTDNGTSTGEATTTKTKTPAKKPAPKKKGTR
ncbi:MAG: hypothetical protein ACR2MG_03360 [Pyrinomonadaceae bacterium]